MQQIALTIAEACAASRIGKTRVYDAIRTGDLTARKYGNRTLILAEDLRRWLEALPAIEPRQFTELQTPTVT